MEPDTKTDVTGACFAGADLRGADLRHVIGLTPEQINTAVVDESTLLPQGFPLPSLDGSTE